VSKNNNNNNNNNNHNNNNNNNNNNNRYLACEPKGEAHNHWPREEASAG
jgi:hypothetical protein